jgi:hypothetical protein
MNRFRISRAGISAAIAALSILAMALAGSAGGSWG